MQSLRKIFYYALAAGFLFNPSSASADEIRYYSIKKSNKTIELLATNQTTPDSLESLVIESFWGKQVKKTRRDVPVLMYHDIGMSGEYGPRYTVSPDMFRKQLDALYSNHYVPVSLSEYVNGTYKLLPPDRKPIVLTFDDATEGQFRYLVDTAKGRHIDPDCGVAILYDFCRKHPDFRMKATFFIDLVDKHGNFQVPFGQAGYEKEKIQKIISLGMEIGNHTLEHINMKVTHRKEASNSLDYLDYIVGLIDQDYRVESFAYPYGAVPGSKEKNAEIVGKFDYACIAWGGVAPDIGSGRFDRYRIPRIEINNDMKNLKMYVLGRH